MGSTIHVPPAGAFLGAMIEAGDDHQPLVVYSVQPGSPAFRAGVRAGDRILGVGGEVFGSEELPRHARKFWLQEGEPLLLHIRDRQGSMRTVEIR